MLLNQCFDFTEYEQMDIALISDTHAEISQGVLDVVSQCDVAIHAGDICSMEVLEQLKPKLEHVIAVAGNNDKAYIWEMKDWDVVKSLPEKIKIKCTGGQISVEHGHLHDMNKPGHDSLRSSSRDAKVVVYGHTHHQVIDDEEDIIVVNPGACGKTRTHGGPSCLKLSINRDEWQFTPYRFED